MMFLILGECLSEPIGEGKDLNVKCCEKSLIDFQLLKVYAPEAYSNSASPPRQKLGDEFAFTVILLWHSKGCVLTTHLSSQWRAAL